MYGSENIIRILKDAKNAIEQNDSQKLKVLSDQTLHGSTIHQNAENIIVAVLTYSISKIMEREKYKQFPEWNSFFSSLKTNIDDAIRNIETHNTDGFMLSLGKIRNSINDMSGDFSNNIRTIFYKAEINKAFKLYEHGLSAEQTANILGISLWDLAKYSGQSSVSESSLTEVMPVEKRIKLAEEFFK